MLSNTRTWKPFPSNTRKGLRHYIKRVFQPTRPMCSQAREGPPALSQPTAAPGTSGGIWLRPGRRRRPAGPSPASGEVGFSTTITTHTGTCTSFFRSEGTEFHGLGAHHLLRSFVMVECSARFLLFLPSMGTPGCARGPAEEANCELQSSVRGPRQQK